GSPILVLITCSTFFFQAEDGIRDRNVTGVQTCALPIMLPRIMGKMPYRSLPGFQFVPSRNLSGPISAMVGMPFANRNTQISATAKIDTQAQTVNTHCMTVSLVLTDLVFILLYLALLAQCKRNDGRP